MSKKMKKGKTISMVLIIVMIVLLAGGIVRSVDIVTKEEMSNEEVEKSTQDNTEDLYIIKDAANNEFSTEIKPPMAPAKIPVVEEAKQQVLAFSSEQQRDNFIKELNIIKVFNNQIRVEDNKVIYTAWNQDEKDVSLAETYNAVIIFDEKGAIESKTYTKKYSEELTRKTIIKPKELTEKSWINDLLDYIIIDSNANGEIDNGDKKIDISKAQMGITDVSYEYEKGVYSATLKDGSKGELKEIGEEKKLLRFVYETEENVVHTLQSLDGGGTLEFYDKNTEEGDKGTGTITIIRGSEKIKFYGTFDEDGMIVKDGKTILAKLDNGNILTDYKGGEPQTIYYAKDTFGYKEYAFGRIQKDGSENVYLSGYVPFAFKPKEGETVFIKVDKEGNYVYTDINGNVLSENIASVKEAKAMVTKSLIGPAFEAAVEGARGGIALSNLLNSWLDIDFITNWRKKTDEFFSETVIGRIISGKWEESVCHSKIEKIPDSIAVVNINNIMGFAAHVEGERSSAIKTNNQTLYFYKITFGVNPYGMGNITFELLIDGHVVDLDNDGMADKIKLEADKTYSGTGEKAVVRYKDKIYEEVCIKFYNTENLNAEFRNSLKDDKLCNKIVEVDLSSVEISEPASSTAVSSTSTGQQGW
ncbi:MAG: hypothetical protein KKF74_05340 [Nanoarchaeota archaeon]|nr:hypothetical protein [Nanoarchaeota archaeon]